MFGAQSVREKFLTSLGTWHRLRLPPKSLSSVSRLSVSTDSTAAPAIISTSSTKKPDTTSTPGTTSQTAHSLPSRETGAFNRDGQFLKHALPTQSNLGGKNEQTSSVIDPCGDLRGHRLSKLLRTKQRGLRALRRRRVRAFVRVRRKLPARLRHHRRNAVRHFRIDAPHGSRHLARLASPAGWFAQRK
jgi:hypothetical protein